MSRFSYIARNPKRALGALAALGVSAAVVGTGASFVYDTESAATKLASGKLVMTGSAGETIFGEEIKRLNILPGERSNWQKAITNDSSSTYNAACKVKVKVLNVVQGDDPQSAATGDPIDFIKFGMSENTTNSQFNGGPYSPTNYLRAVLDANNEAIFDVSADSMTPGERRVFGFGWAAPDNGRGADNKYESSSLDLKVTWLCDATKL